MLIDVHAHASEISRCCKANSYEVLTAARDAFIDGIALTNHYAKKYINDGDPESFAKRYVDAYYNTKKLGDEMGMPVFFGIEISVEYQKYVHMLVYGVDTDFILQNPEIYDYSFEKLHKTVHESGGVLVGRVEEEFGKENIIVSGFVEGKYCEATPTTLTFTHETWDYMHKEIEKKHPGTKIVGWIHTHPDFGIFLSEYDKFIHKNFFSEENQIAYVVDPIQNEEGFYFWINEKIERCTGFFLYDKNGVAIDVTAMEEKEPETEVVQTGARLWIRDIVLAVLCVAVVLLFLANRSLRAEVQELKTEQQHFAQITEQNFRSVEQYFNYIFGGYTTVVPDSTTPEADSTTPEADSTETATAETEATTGTENANGEN